MKSAQQRANAEQKTSNQFYERFTPIKRLLDKFYNLVFFLSLRSRGGGEGEGKAKKKSPALLFKDRSCVKLRLMSPVNDHCSIIVRKFPVLFRQKSDLIDLSKKRAPREAEHSRTLLIIFIIKLVVVFVFLAGYKN